MNVEQRQAVERKVVRHLVRAMKARGWQAAAVNDGEEVVKCKTEKDVMDAVFSVDESHIRFVKDGIRRTAFIVLGNDGWDAICDHSCSSPDVPGDDFEQIMSSVVDPYCSSLEERS